MYRFFALVLLPGPALAVSFFSHLSTIPEVPVIGEPFVVRIVAYSDEHFAYADSTLPTEVSADRIELTYFQPQTLVALPPRDPYRQVFVVGPFRAGGPDDVLGSGFEVEFRAPNAWSAFPADVAGRAQFVATDAPGATPLVGSGVWWNPAAPGIGYAVDVQDDFAFVVEFAFSDDQPRWRTIQGPLEGGRYLEADLLLAAPGVGGPITVATGIGRLVFEHRSRAWLAMDDGPFVSLERFRTTASQVLGPDDQFPTVQPLPRLAGSWLLVEHEPAAGGTSRVLTFSGGQVERSGPLPIVSYSAGDDDGIICEANAFAFIPGQAPDLPADLPPFESYSCRLLLDGRLDLTVPFDLDAMAPERIDLGMDSSGARSVLLRIREP